MMSYKKVDNYQLSESSSYVEDGIQIYIAQHIVSKLPYLLKMVNTKDSSDKIKYQRLVNQIGILKILSHPSIVECHKMLKTSNNIYLVYDYCDGSSLTQFLSNSTRDQKINIIIQLIEGLKTMAKASVVHCNLKPSSIIVSTDGKIKIMNYTYGHNLENKKSIPIKFKPPSSNYIAPEIIKQNIVYDSSDLYSLGVILSESGICQNNALTIANNSYKQLATAIEKLKSNDPNARPELKQIQIMLKQSMDTPNSRKKSQDPQRKKTKQEDLQLKKANSVYSNNSDRSDKKNIFSVSTVSPKDSIEKEKKFVQQILKKRNLTIFLLQISQACLRIQDEDRKLGIFLSYILMKKSCNAICNLVGYLKGEKQYEKQIQNPALDRTERLNFEKKPDYFKLRETIQKQAANQKKWIEDLYRSIASQLPQKWKEVADEQTVNDKTLLVFIVDFLHEALGGNEDALNDKLVQSLYLMSEIIPHKSFENLFDEMISEQKVSLDEQQLYIHVKKLKKKQLLSQIASRIKSQT